MTNVSGFYGFDARPPGKIGRIKKETRPISAMQSAEHITLTGNTIYRITRSSGKRFRMILPGFRMKNFLKYFVDTELPKLKRDSSRSSCLHIGAFLVIQKIMEEYSLPQMLTKYLGAEERRLFLNLCAYSIICENNAGQYYPMYTYKHPFLTDRMLKMFFLCHK